MAKLPKIRFALDAAPREKLVRWLLEWEADCALRGGEPQPEASEPVPVLHGKGSLPGEIPPAAGQVRLLHPNLLQEEAGPRYIALLGPARVGTWWIAPFSRFAEPALPGELSVDTGSALRVLCVWNQRPISGATLLKTWRVADLSADALSDARSLHEAVRRDLDPPAHLRARTGPPVRHPLDPRHDYIEEERAIVERLRAGAAPLVYEPPADRRVLPLAAEERPRYRVECRYLIEGTPLNLLLRPGLHELVWDATVVDAAGRLTLELDGCVIEAAGGPRSDAIREGGTRVIRFQQTAHLALLHPDGTRRILRRLG